MNPGGVKWRGDSNGGKKSNHKSRNDYSNKNLETPKE
jgi:hypothetical protein